MIDFLGPRVHTTHFCVTTPFSAAFSFFCGFFYFIFFSSLSPAMTRNAFQISSGMLSKFAQIHKLHHLLSRGRAAASPLARSTWINQILIFDLPVQAQLVRTAAPALLRTQPWPALHI